MTNLRVVLDTNVILRAISSKSELALLLEYLFENKYSIIFSNEILFEYEEKITQFYGKNIAANFLDFIIILPNAEKIQPYFSLNLINNDKDDNKFVDCAFTANATYIVTNDKHFDILKNVEFPKIPIIKAEEFKEFLEKL